MTTPEPGSTHLRDARLRKALEHAPDAHAAAPAAIREAILRQARDAAAPIPAPTPTVLPSPWWKRMLGSPPRAARPWNTAFASVLLAGVVVGLWWDREVPGPQPDASTRDVPAAMPAPAPAAPEPSLPPAQTPAPAPASTPTPAPAPAGAAARDAPRPRSLPSAPMRQDESKVAAPDAMSSSSSSSSPSPPPATQELSRDKQAAAGAQDRSREKPSEAGAPDARARDDTPPPSSTAEQRRSSVQRAESDLRSSRIAPAPSAPDTPSAAAPPSQLGVNAFSSRRSAPQSTVPAPAAMPDAAGWTALRVLSGAGQARTRGSVPADVAQAIGVMLDTGATGVPADDPVLLQILLLHEGGRPLGRLDLGSHSLRWTPAGAGTPRAFAARVEPALSLRVREGLALK